MNLATLIDLQSIDMSLFRRAQNNQRVRADIARRAYNRRDEDDDDERERIARADEHAHDMKVIEMRRVALLHQDQADRRAEHEALRAWREAPQDRRER